jgi:Icc-related predicted phosphoesterase
VRVLIVGDVHGRLPQLAAALRQAQADFRIEVAIQVGDFGFGRESLQRAREEHLRFPVPVHAIDGNHEDHAWLSRAVLLGTTRTWQKELNLIYQPRPSAVRLGSSVVGFLGGALHVDRPQRHNLLAGLPNYILRRQRERAAALFNRERCDLMVTHSCPAGIGIGLRSSAEHEHSVGVHVRGAGFDPGPVDDCGEIELARLWEALSHRPSAWVFGHFHRAHQATVEGTRFVSVDDQIDGPTRRLTIWDTEEKKLLVCPADPSGG